MNRVYGIGIAAAILAPFSAAHASFERPPAGPEDAALAEILSVGADATFGNPAAPFDAAPLHVDAWSAQPFGIEELRESQVSGSARFGRWGGAAGFRNLGASHYFEREARTALAFAPAPAVSFGVAARAMFVGGDAFVMERAFAGDMGLRARLDDSTELGLHLESVLGGVPGDPDRRLARSALGVARALPGNARVLVELARRADRNPSVAAGASWSPHPAVTLRGGLREEPFSFAWGATLRAAGAAFSFSSTETEALGRTVRVGVSYVRRAREDAPSGRGTHSGS